MSDGTEAVAAEIAAETAVKETPNDSVGTGTAAPESGQPGQDRAGDSQEPPEGGSAENNQNRRRGTSPFSQNRELRQQLRQMESTYNSRLQELEARLEKFGGPKNGDESSKPRKTFWEAPEEILDERMQGHLSEFEKRLLTRLEADRTASQESSEWKQEVSEAAKLIQSDNSLQPDDIADIEDIVRSTPAMQNLRPLERAKYAKYLWQQERGIGDKSALKNKASSFTGAPPVAGGKREWTESSMEQELKKFPVDPGKWTSEEKAKYDALEKEFSAAYREKRVRK